MQPILATEPSLQVEGFPKPPKPPAFHAEVHEKLRLAAPGRDTLLGSIPSALRFHRSLPEAPHKTSAPPSGIAVLIPAWQPEPILVTLVEELLASGLALIVIVDDGSVQAAQAPIFNRLRHLGLPVLRHAVNLGKGRALKSGFNYLLTEHPGLHGVITADADGQHRPADILRVAEALVASRDRPVLGVRSFAGEVPFRSRFGNALTRHIFALVTGVKLRDTQTGLRGLPLPLLPQLMALEGERYEYEMTMLAHLCRTGGKPLEVPIETVYFDNNRSSHFNPVWDSMRIYFVLARFLLSSVLAAGIDFAGFALAFALTRNVLVSVLVGRLSSLVNFALNRRFVFHNRGSVARALWRYYALALLVGLLSYGLIWTLNTPLHWDVFAAKLCVDGVLSLLSFSVQRTLIFRRSEAL